MHVSTPLLPFVSAQDDRRGMFELPSTVSSAEFIVLVRTRPGKELVTVSLKSIVSVL